MNLYLEITSDEVYAFAVKAYTEAWKLVTEALDGAPHPNYISVQEIDEKSWGYNGLRGCLKSP